MGWFTSDKELREREAQVQAKYNEIKAMLQSQQNEITIKFQDLGNLGTSIMMRSDLEAAYQEQLKNLETQRSSLAAAVQTYQEAASRFMEQEQDLAAREKVIVAQECDAKAAFATALDDQMAPLRQLKSELDAKGQRIISMQEEFNKNFALQDQKLLEDFRRLGASLKEKFDSLQSDMLKEKEAIAQREDGLNKREMELSLREAEVRQGLTEERSKMLLEFNEAKGRLAQQEEALKKMADELSQRRMDLERQESDLANRIEAVQIREASADAGFAKEKESMLSQLQETRDATAKNMVELQKAANEQCDKFLQEWQGVLAEARTKMLEGLTADVQERRASMSAESQALVQQKNELLQREQELLKRENEIQVAQTTIANAVGSSYGGTFSTTTADAVKFSDEVPGQYVFDGEGAESFLCEKFSMRCFSLYS
ncbi:MAG: hypothetical protein MJ106_00650, partial [Lentisphaeria bacterium]|nr:hypothetical protein [Lentisphaeria bacterium]